MNLDEPFWMKDKRYKEHFDIVEYDDWGCTHAIINIHTGNIVGTYSGRIMAEKMVRTIYLRQEQELEKILLGKQDA